MKKIIIIAVAGLLLLFLGICFYLYSRPCDYKVSFTTEASPDVAWFHILNWDTWNRKQRGVQIKVTEKQAVSYIQSQVALNDTILDFQWIIEARGDSMTKVSACVSDPSRRLKNRLSAPVFSTAFKRSVRNNILDIMQRLESMRKTFNYEFVGPAYFEGRDCVYMTVQCGVRQKAASMITTVTDLNQFVRKNGLGLDGHPFLLIHDWKVGSDSIRFDFCFPISKHEAIPSHSLIRYKRVKGMEAVRSDFHGNYSITDLCWFKLAEELGDLGYKSTGTLIEVYHNDPHSGTNELEWKAEIFLGIQKDQSPR
jgi:effector-binding domain-containing protein